MSEQTSDGVKPRMPRTMDTAKMISPAIDMRRDARCSSRPGIVSAKIYRGLTAAE
jgi:hypothetical protein